MSGDRGEVDLKRQMAATRFTRDALIATELLHGGCRGVTPGTMWMGGVWMPAHNVDRARRLTRAMSDVAHLLRREMSREEQLLVPVVGAAAGLVQNGDPVTNMRRGAGLAVAEMNACAGGTGRVFDGQDLRLLEEGMLATLEVADANGHLIQPVGVEQIMGRGGGEFELMQKLAADAARLHLVDTTSLQHGVGEYLEGLRASGIELPPLRRWLDEVPIDVDDFSAFVDRKIEQIERHRFQLPVTQQLSGRRSELATHYWRWLREEVLCAVERGVFSGAALRQASETGEAYAEYGLPPNKLGTAELPLRRPPELRPGVAAAVERICGRATRVESDGPLRKGEPNARLAVSDVLRDLEQQFGDLDVHGDDPWQPPEPGAPGPPHPPEPGT